MVVFGILIALQINNWNENRKNIKIANQYKKSLLRDLEQDLRSIEIRIENSDSRIYGVERFLNYLENDIEYGEFAKREDIIRAGWLNFFDPVLGTYNDLISSGNINLIKDDSLKILMNDYVSHFNRIRVYEEHDKKNVWDQYGLYYRKWIDGRINSAYLTQDSLQVLAYSIDWESIKENKDFKRRLTLVLETCYGQIARYQRLKAKIEYFIAYLETDEES